MTDSLHPEHQDLLQFLYQFPVGVIGMDEDGVVSKINPAASRILQPEVEDGESVREPLPLLRRLVPELIERLTGDRDRLGMISTGRGHIVDGRDGESRFSVTAHRLRPGQIVVSMTDVTEERRILNEQRARAQRLQRALLGTIDPTDLELSVAYLPAHREDLSGGDWYDVINLGGDRVALIVGDVVGHDIEASATMGQLRAIVRAFALVDDEPAGVLARTDRIARTIDDATCATINYVVLDLSASTIAFASAGHPPPLLIRSDGSAALLNEGRRPALAATPSTRDQSASASLEPGDVLVMYTDGLVERRDESIDQGLERLRSTAMDLVTTESIDDFVGDLTRKMLDGTKHRDDVCVLAIRNDRRPR